MNALVLEVTITIFIHIEFIRYFLLIIDNCKNKSTSIKSLWGRLSSGRSYCFQIYLFISYFIIIIFFKLKFIQICVKFIII